jgi:YVTN family beta-propeller protein
VIATVPVDGEPVTGSLGVNSVTNKIYVSTWEGNITVIDGGTNSATTVRDPNAQNPYGLTVNPVTNKIYVANWGGNVTVIDGATNTTTTVRDPNANGSHFVAVNSVTNKIYVANWNSGNVTVIDGATNSTTTVPTGTNPQHVAVNPVTNKIYVPNWGSDNVTVIDGATNSTTTVRDPNASVPGTAAVNPRTNKVYVTNYESDNVTVIDGATNSFTTVTDPNAVHPGDVAVNPVTNKIYVVNGGPDGYAGSNNLTVIDGTTNSTATVRDPNASQSMWVAVNSLTNKIYVANWGSNNVTVIDGATNSTTTVTDPNASRPNEVDLNPATNRIYVVNGWWGGSNNVTVIDGAGKAPGLTLTPSSLSFPLLRTVGTTSLAHTVKLTNVGSADLDITGITLTGRNSGDFAQSNNCTPTVAVGASCLITVTFTPTAQGVRTASVSITDSATGNPQSVPLTGRGTFLKWAPRQMFMGDQPVGTSSPAQTVRLTNVGTAPISIFSIGIGGVNPGDFRQTNTCGSSLNPGASCTIEVTFNPTAVGGRQGHVAIRDSAFGGTHWVGLIGKGA